MNNKHTITRRVNLICYVRRTHATLFFHKDLEFFEVLKFYILSFLFFILKTKNPLSPHECRSEIKINMESVRLINAKINDQVAKRFSRIRNYKI